MPTNYISINPSLCCDFSSTKGRGGMERAGLSDYAQHTLREICSQEWVREKFLKDPKALFNSELLLDKMLSHAQVSYVMFR